ncbi:MAG: GDP-mannose 4,6-dehydratase [Smithellaceae bacterium]
MKLLITGGCGFLGSNLASHALSRDDDLLVFDNMSRHGAMQNLIWLQEQGNFSFIHGDIRNQNDIEIIIKSFLPDCVFHLAGQVAMTTSIDNPRMDFEINTMGTLNLLEAIRKYVPEATVIYSSTNKVYGDLEQFTYRETDTRYECVERPYGFDENTPLDFRTPYGCSKGAADQYMIDYARIYGLNTVVFRHSSMYGGRQFATFDQGWIGWFCQQAIAEKFQTLKEPFTISGNGKQVRDVLHADDMVRLYFLAAQNIERARGHAFNIGGGIKNSLSLLDLFIMLEQLLNLTCPLKFKIIEKRLSDQYVFIADIHKVRAVLGWYPFISAKHGVAKMLDWLKSVNLS